MYFCCGFFRWRCPDTGYRHFTTRPVVPRMSVNAVPLSLESVRRMVSVIVPAETEPT